MAQSKLKAVNEIHADRRWQRQREKSCKINLDPSPKQIPLFIPLSGQEESHLPRNNSLSFSYPTG